MGAQFSVGESVREEAVDEQGLQEGVNAGVGEAQRGDAGAFGCDDGVVEGGEDFGAGDGVVADALGVE